MTSYFPIPYFKLINKNCDLLNWSSHARQAGPYLLNTFFKSFLCQMTWSYDFKPSVWWTPTIRVDINVVSVEAKSFGLLYIRCLSSHKQANTCHMRKQKYFNTGKGRNSSPVPGFSVEPLWRLRCCFSQIPRRIYGISNVEWPTIQLWDRSLYVNSTTKLAFQSHDRPSVRSMKAIIN